jgi:hypothetical protein
LKKLRAQNVQLVKIKLVRKQALPISFQCLIFTFDLNDWWIIWDTRASVSQSSQSGLTKELKGIILDDGRLGLNT